MPLDPKRTPADLLGGPGQSLSAFLWRASGYHQLCLCSLSLIVALLIVAPIELHKRIVDDVIVDQQLDLLFILGGVYLAVVLTKVITKYVYQVYQGWLIESTALRLRRQLTARYETMSGAREEAADGAAVTVIGTESDKLAGFVGEAVSQISLNLGMLLLVGGYMLVEQWLIGVAALLILLPQMILVPLLQRRINRLIETRLGMLRRLGDEVAALCGESHDEADKAAGETIEAVYANRLKIFFWKFLSKALVNLLNNLAPVVLLVFGGYLVIEGETSLGVLVAFLSGLERISDPLRDLVAHYREIAQARVQHARLTEWIEGGPGYSTDRASAE